MPEDLFPETINKGCHGAEWWIGRRQCRNWHGFFQSRHEGRGTWQFGIPWCRVAFKSGTLRVERRLLPLNVAFRHQLVGVFLCFAVRSGQLLQEGGVPFQTHEARQLLRTHRGQC